ncbi:hypothetical protein [Leptolyngbya sp. O-77]|uniref:hypothetical protein n=1 Tax=Leptolyngbya sp. O-77 TaxID=1080068 RepID=UPI00074D4290|nr:hypothetical protein [Leptolyngbya sp. O-77]BAU44057.1 hypothetical protein O77CONTIG1_03892 [Leptolyngbya sp. O-77]
MERFSPKQMGVVAGGVFVAIALSAGAALAQSRELWMASGDTTSVTGYFMEGERIWGTCDEDCQDLDITLLSADGEPVAEDVLPDANPVVVAPFEGSYTLVITMPTCTTPAGCAVWLDSDQGF